MLVLSIATSIDAFAAGITITALGYLLMIPSIFVGVITFCLSFCGVYLGCWMSNQTKMKKYFTRLGAVILIGIGVKILIEHLI
jgi:putative Mn2+ efflux pump MntP